MRYTPAEDEVVLSVEELIEAGLRAELATESFVTGQLVVELRLHPDKPAIFRGVKVRSSRDPERAEQHSGHPRQDSALCRGSFSSESTSIKVLRDVEETLGGLNELVNSKDLRDALAGMIA